VFLILWEISESLLHDMPAAILVTMEFKPIRMGNIRNVAFILFCHGIDYLGQDLQVSVSDDYGYCVHHTTPQVSIDAGGPALFTNKITDQVRAWMERGVHLLGV